MARRRIVVQVTLEYDPRLGSSEDVVDAFRHLVTITPCAALTEDLGVELKRVGRSVDRPREVHTRPHDSNGYRHRVWDRRQRAYGSFDVVDSTELERLRSDPAVELTELFTEEDDVPFTGDPP